MMVKQTPRMQPYQKEVLDMLDSLPEGMEIKVALSTRRRGRGRVYTTFGGHTYIYHGGKKWRRLR